MLVADRRSGLGAGIRRLSRLHRMGRFGKADMKACRSQFGPRQREALQEADPDFLAETDLAFFLEALEKARHSLLPEGAHHSPQHVLAIKRLDEAVNPRGVELDDIRLESLDPLEVGIVGAVIIHGDLEMCGAQLFHHQRKQIVVAALLGDLADN